MPAAFRRIVQHLRHTFLDRPWTAVAAIGTLGLTAFLALQPLSALDTDMWWHLAQGRLFVRSGLPRHDPFSFTSDVPLIPMEWLYDVMTYGLYRVLGTNGLILLRLTALLADALALYLLVRNRMRAASVPMEDPLYAVMAWASAALAMAVSRSVFFIRPQIVMWLLFMTAQFLLYAYADGRISARRLVVSLVALTVVWVNLHPTWLLIPIMLGLRTCADMLSRRGARARTWALALAACALASLLNPQGFRIALHPFAYMTQSLYTQSLVEYRPPNPQHHDVPWFQMLLAMDVAALIGAVVRRDPFTVFMLLGLTRQALSGQRYIPFLALFLMPVAASQTAAAVTGWTRARREAAPAAHAQAWTAAVRVFRAGGWCALAIGGWLAVTAIGARLPLSRAIDWRTYPTNATRFILDNRIPGRIFNPFEWGGWLTWTMPPGRIFIDGRCFTVYSDAVYRDYLRVANRMDDWRKILDKYGVDVAITDQSIPNLGLNASLVNDSGWSRVFDDELSRVYIRRKPATAMLIQRLRHAAIRPHTPTMDDADGLHALRSGRTREACALFVRAIERDPSYAEPRLHFGIALAMEGKREPAAALWEQAIRLDPDLFETHFNLGLYYELKGERERAVHEYQAELAIDPQYERAMRALQRLGAGP